MLMITLVHRRRKASTSNITGDNVGKAVLRHRWKKFLLEAAKDCSSTISDLCLSPTLYLLPLEWRWTAMWTHIYIMKRLQLMKDNHRLCIYFIKSY